MTDHDLHAFAQAQAEREFSREVGMVFQAEWRRAQHLTKAKAFLSGVLIAAAISLLARLI